ncbi:ketopantoate reductase family protein [Rhodospirillum sp. A1_3_36]|uniref:ketopantoate reductase family protein n=1 Tax=Rhodospirillum sp. A1_3_36 TaxID=3391666 RepID=UPI0039A6B386
MTWAILGAGALGSVIGAELFKGGADIVLLDTNDAHLTAIQSKGLRVDWDDKTDYLPVPAMRPVDAPELDLVILLTKTMHSQAALASIEPSIAAGACVLTLQNGLGNVEQIRSQVPDEQILYGCTMTPGDLRGPGHVVSHGIAYTPFAPLTENPAAKRVADQLVARGFEKTSKAAAKIWEKASFNCAMNAMAVLGEGPVGLIAEFVGGALACQIANEVLDVAAADGVVTDRDAVAAQIDFALEKHTAHKPSMLQDIEAGRATEIEALNGYAATRGTALGVPVPLNTLLASLVRMKQHQRLA